MTDVRLPSSGNIIVRWHAANAFANPAKPTPTEVNAGLNITDAISWNDFDFNLSASNTNNDPSLAAKSNVADRGAAQYGGSISLYLPKDLTDMTNLNAVAHAALNEPRTVGWLSIQIDGEASENNTPLYTGGLTQTAQAGDFISLFKVMTTGYAHAITGEEAFRETVTFLPQGDVQHYVIVASSYTVDVSPATATPEPGDIIALTATVNGRDMTRAGRWTTSDPDVATVSQNGIVTIVGDDTDTATITFTYNGSTDTAAITVTDPA